MLEEPEDNGTILITYLEKEIVDLFKARPSVCIMILGRRGTGKTDFSLLVLEALFNLKIMNLFATNIKIYESPFPIEQITNLQDLESWAKNNNGRKCFILDEAGKVARRRTPMSALNVALLDDLQILRKYKLSLIMITPATKYIDSATMGSDVLDVIFLKPYFDNQKVGVWIDQQVDYRMTYTGIPATTIKFDSFDVATFVKSSPSKIPKFSDIDTQLLWDWSHGTPSKTLGVSLMKIHRLSTKYVKESLEREHNI